MTGKQQQSSPLRSQIAMMTAAVVLAICLLSTSSDAFVTPSRPTMTTTTTTTTFGISTRHEGRPSSSSLSMAVVDIDGEAAFDKTVKSAGDSLVVVDYSTTW
jgi:hypothetical protein